MDLPNPSVENVIQASQTLGLPLLLKARRQAYDGRGNSLVRNLADAQANIDTLHGPLYAERYEEGIVSEIAVVLVRATNGEVRNYGAVENVKVGKIGHLVRAPLRQGSGDVSRRVQELAEKAVHSLPEGAVGVFGVEFFLLADGTITPNSQSW